MPSPPAAAVRAAIAARSRKYSPIEVGTRFRISTVGPTTNRNTASTTANTMLMLDSHWMPLATPDTAEATNATVSTAMMVTSRPVPVSPSQPAARSPLPICSAPRPSEAAEPNRVAKMASTSMVLPAGPRTRLVPSSGANAALISWLRPRRKLP